jgi:septum formation protein
MPTDFVLASASPRRKELLSKIASAFEISVSKVAEIEPPDCHWSDAALINAVAKAESVAKWHPDALVLGADTLIELSGRILGKPEGLAGARAMLRELSGRAHTVATGVCLIGLKARVKCRFVDRSEVVFKTLSDATIDAYLERVHVLDKAGAYAIQECGEMIVERVDGSFDNVIGLPTGRVAEAIAAAGFGSLLKN